MKKQYSNPSSKRSTKKMAPVNQKQARKPLISALEPRLLLDGAAVATAVDVLTDSQLHDASQTDASQQDSDTSVVIAPTEVRAADPSLNNGKKEVVFIEDNVADYQTLIDGMNAGVEVVLLDSTQDGLAQMALWAESNSDYDAIHIISHGAEGQVNLGGFSLDNITVNTRSADLAQLGAALNEDGDLLLYGCDVASGEGQDFITALAQATQADVAASDDLTGAAVLGGDWVLEKSAGSVETTLTLTNKAMQSYVDVFAATSDNFDGYGANISPDVTSFSLGDWTFGSSSAMGMANASAGDAAIHLNNDEGAGDRAVFMNYESTQGFTDFYFKSTDGTDFNLNSFDIGNNFILAGTNVTIVGYKDGVEVAGTSELVDLTASDSSGVITYSTTDTSSDDGYFGTLTFGSAYDAVDEVRFTFDANGSLAIDNLNVSPAAANNAPTITGAPADITVTEDTASNVNLSGVTFADSDGDNLTVTLTASAGTLVASSSGNVTVSGSGTGALTLSGSSADINSYLDTTSNVQYTGASNASGDNAATLSIKANDGTTDSSISTVNIDITAVNDAPTAVSPTTGTVSTFDSDNATVATVSATDVDDSTWKYSIQSITLDSASQTNDGSLFNFVTDANTLVATNALRATTPSGLTAGTYIVTVVATDAEGLSTTQEISVTVTDSLVVTTANDTSENAADAYNGNSYAAELADGGGLSLREALGLAQAGGKTIAFDASLNGANISLDSMITVADGTVFQLANSTSFTISGSNLFLEGALTVDNASGNTLTLSASLTDSNIDVSTLNKTGAGTLVLSGTNNSGNAGLDTIRATAGTLQISDDDNLGTGNVILSGGATFATANIVLEVDNTFAIETGGATFNQTGIGHLTLSGAVEGDSLLTKSGGGNMTLSGNYESFIGNVLINNGTLYAQSSLERLGDLGVTLSGGTLDISGATLFESNITFTGNAVINNSNALTLSGVISGTGDLTKSGTGVLTLSGDSANYSGDIILSQGVIIAAHNNALGNATGSTTVSSGATLRVGNGLTLAENLTISGVGVNAAYGALKINEGAGSATLTGDITLAADSLIGAFNSGDSLTLSGVISGDFDLTKVGSGTLTLSGANTHSGAVTVSQGTLALSGGSSIGDDSDVTVNTGATLSLTGAAETIGSLEGAGSVSLSSDLTLGNASSTLFSGVISSTNSSGITKVGSGSLTLSGANTYTGSTIINAGTLYLENGSAIADSSAVTINSGAEIELYLSDETIGSLAGAGTLTLNGGSLTVGGNNSDTIFSGQIQDGGNSGGLIKTGSGTLTLTAGDGINTYSGGTTVDSGTLAISRSSHLGTGTIILDGGTLQMLSGGNFSFANAMTNALVLASDSTIDTASGVYAKWSNVISGSGSLTKTGTGSLGVTAVNTYTGDTTLSEGAIVIDSATATLGGADAGNGNAYGTLTIHSGAHLDFNYGATIANDLVIGGVGVGYGAIQAGFSGTDVTFTGAVTLSSDTLVDPGNITLEFSGGISDGGNGYTLTNAWNGTVKLSGAASNWTGGISTAANHTGKFSITDVSNIGSGQITLNGGSLIIADATTLSNAVTIGSGGGSIDASDSVTLSGVLSGTDAFTKAGAGTLTLTGTNTHSGAVTVSAGTLALSGGSSIGDDSAVTVNSGATLSLTGGDETIGSLSGSGAIALTYGLTVGNASNSIFSGVISSTNSSGIIKVGSGTLTLSGANTYTGSTTVSAGKLLLQGGSAIADSSAVTIGSGAELELRNNETVGSLAGAGSLTLNGGTLTTGGNDSSTTFSGVIQDGDGTGGLTKTGSGTLTLTGNNTYSGATTVSAGTLIAGSDTALGAATAGTAVSSGATLQLGSGVSIAENVSIAGIGGLVLNSGTATLSGSLTATAAARVTINNSASLTVSGTLGGAFDMYKMGTGTLVLSGTNSGATTTNLTVSSGILSITDASNLTGGSLTLNTGASGSLTVTGSDVTINKNVVLGVSGGRIVNANDLTMSGVISGTGALTKAGVGVLTLDATNTYTGATSVTDGTLKTNTAGINATSGLTLNGGTLSALSSSLSKSFTISLGSNGGTLDLSNGSMALSGGISGLGDLTIISTNAGNAVALSGDNTFTGGTTLVSGILGLESDTAVGTGVLTIDGGKVRSTGAARIIANDLVVNTTFTMAGSHGLTFTGDVDLGGGTRVFNNGLGVGKDLTLSGVISNGNLIVSSSGQGQVILSGNNAYGATSVTAGKLSVAGDSNLGSDIVTLNGGTMMVTGTTTIDNAITIGSSGGTVNNADAVTLSGVVSGTGALTKAGVGTMTLSATNTHTGSVTVSAGTMAVSGGSSIGDDSAVTVNSGATLSLTGGNETIGSLAGSGAVSLGYGLTVGNASNTTFSGVISSTNTSGITKVGTGTLTLSGVNTYTGSTTVSAGTLVVTGGSAIDDTSAVTVASGATFKLDIGESETVGSIAGAGTISANGGTLTVGGNNTSTTFSGVIGEYSGGTMSLTKIGNGTLTLTGSNTYTGNTAVLGGGLSITDDSNLGSGVLTLNSGTLSVTGDGANIDNAISLSFNGGVVNVDTGVAATLSGVISGSGSLTKSSAGEGGLTLSGTNTYTGSTTINGGTLSVTGTMNGSGAGTVTLNAGTLEGTGTINSAVTINSGATLSAGVAANTGTLTINGDLILDGTLSAQLNSVNDYDKIVVTGGVTLGADSTFDVANSVSTSGNTFVLIDNDGSDAVTGTLNGVEEGETLISNSLGYRTSYVGGTGNDVTLQDNSAPVITSGGTASVDENAATSTVVYTATATDDDNDTVSFSLTGDDATAFDIDSSTGEVTLKASADYETKASYSFSVVATDNSTGNLTDTQAVTVSVNDLNDNAPVMTSGATASIDENADIGTVVYTATATDADGTSANNTISFSLTGTDAAAFDIDSSTGVVTLKVSADYEAKASYSFNVVATDNGTGNLTDTQAVTVSVNDLNDNAPVITSGATASIDENAATSTVVYTATATDADGTSANNMISFSLTGTDAAAFDIDSSTGVVTLKASADYETKASYSFNVVATDNGTGNLTDTQAVTVSVNDLNDNAPVVTSGATASIDENAATSTVVYTATATDADGTSANNMISFSLTGTDAAAFDIDSSTGVVTLKSSADYETKASYSFNVMATDNGTGNMTDTQAVTVSVNDLNDNAPVVTSGATASIDENAATSTVVYTATATDADGTSANNAISFSLTGTDAAAFDIDSSTGVVTLKSSADYETKASYSFNVV
ncbi:cadherin domain-containing protein, partial [Marinomonas shanghaiensis]|uniref:cadherin domain-containing protein n=1 Tax=Marinomonas shanghaiensis TaxID=2202418 RepID=UPI00130023E1